jgi:DNA modification methylase
LRRRDLLLGLAAFEGSAERGASAMHPTVRPVAMVADALMDCSNRGDIALDPFADSGTTMIAAERTGRHARLIELDPFYSDVIVRRRQAFAGKTARLVESGRAFDAVLVKRQGVQS